MATRLKPALGLVSSVLLAGCSVIGIRSGTPTPDYHVVDHVGDVQIRHYDARLAADTVIATDDVSAARNAGFKRLAGYIFGDNSRDTKIAMTAPVAQSSEKLDMTAPVAQQATDRGWRIRFFLPANLTRQTAPTPDDDRITLTTVPPMDYAVLRFSNSRSESAVDTHIATLRQRLADSAWRPTGPAVAWFYDPPWTLWFLRRNEVALPVRRAD